MTASESCLRVERVGPASILRLDRPGKRNALSRQLIRELTEAFRRLKAERDVAGIIVCGSAEVFSAGADLREAVEIRTADDFAVYSRAWRDLTDVMDDVDKPVIAAISGYCFTGGLELALACDWRVATETATFAITSARIGSVAGFGGTQRLPRVVGLSQAKRMLFAAEPIDAAEAYRIGLIDVLVSSGEAEKCALEHVALYATRGPLSLSLSRRALNVGADLDLNSALDLEQTIVAQVFATADKQEGMSAFLEKRPPRFRGA